MAESSPGTTAIVVAGSAEAGPSRQLDQAHRLDQLEEVVASLVLERGRGRVLPFQRPPRSAPASAEQLAGIMLALWAGVLIGVLLLAGDLEQ